MLQVGDALGMYWNLIDVTEVHKRWYNLRDVAVEIFLNTGQTYLLGTNSLLPITPNQGANPC